MGEKQGCFFFTDEVNMFVEQSDEDQQRRGRTSLGSRICQITQVEHGILPRV